VGELPVVAPLILQVTTETPQLSAFTGLGTVTLALQAFAGALTEISAGQLIVGGAFSTMVTVKLQVSWLPAASLTVYVTVVVPTLNTWDPALLIPVVGEFRVVLPVIAQVNSVTPQLSLTTTSGNAIVASQEVALASWVILAGQVIEGFVPSVTITCWVHVWILPLASAADHVTTVVPIGKVAGASLVMAMLPGQLSVATGVPKLTPVAVHPLFAVMFKVGGQVSAGFTLSITNTVNVQLAELPAASFTV
jgi:hypothetical protein